GIRDFHVTGVQTCALPIFWEQFEGRWEQLVETSSRILARLDRGDPIADTEQDEPPILPAFSGPTEREAVVRIRRAQTFFRRTVRSEERRVGKESRTQGGTQ